MMLSNQTIKIVKSTAPILEQRGKEITTVFYKTMLEEHPELLNIFNHANQKRGRQQTALANTVTAAAYYIDQLDVLLPVVKQIAHKHRSLVIKPEHYPIVGEYLLLAIKEVLGDAATSDILKAWEEAYGAIADIFISIERDMYEEAGNKDGGWREYKDFTVIKKVKESDIITSFYLKPTDEKRLPDFKPGQYITIQVQIPGEQYLMNRQYSLTNAPNGEYYRISVKRESLPDYPAGKVSNYLHKEVVSGDRLKVTAPAGEFTLEEALEPITFIAAGVGITPFMSMLTTLNKQNTTRKITLIHAFKNRKLQAFADELSLLSEQLHDMTTYYYHEEEVTEANYRQGRVNEAVLNQLDKEGVFYVCGPVKFMQGVIQTLYTLGIPKEKVRYEFFGPSIKIESVTETV
jgi:nitric oxide dioxygenase